MLALTSLIFTTNAIHAYYRSAYWYSTALAGLTLSSVALHASDKTRLYENHWFWIDKTMLIIVFSTGLWYTLSADAGSQTVAVLTFLLVIALYYGGYLTDSCCFDECKNSATFSHACMHFIGSVGHHCVIAAIL
jgi:hypothetical protein